jgi:hypothetical protein
MSYVIACGDEGVQINLGTRLGFVGAGFQLDGFSDVVPLLKKLLGTEIAVAANQENDWLKSKLDLSSWEQVNASAQQHIEALADQEGLLYAGYLPFADPKQLEHQIKGHMVRPQGIHIANKICFTLAGGEQKYNLGNFVISAEWVAEAPAKLVQKVILPQIEFYEKLGGGKLIRLCEETGTLGEEVAAKNKKVLEKLGFLA